MWFCLCLSEPFFILDYFGSKHAWVLLKCSQSETICTKSITAAHKRLVCNLLEYLSTREHTYTHPHTHTESHSSMAVSSHLLIKWKQSGDGWFGGHLDNIQSSRSSHHIPNRLVEGEREKRGEDKRDEHSSRWTKAPLHAESQRLYCCEWAGRGGDLPREDRGVQVAPKS